MTRLFVWIRFFPAGKVALRPFGASVENAMVFLHAPHYHFAAFFGTALRAGDTERCLGKFFNV